MVSINWIPMDSVLFRLVKMNSKMDLNVINLNKTRKERCMILGLTLIFKLLKRSQFNLTFFYFKLFNILVK